ncbi:M23 family metallopeptidase [Candidatus Uhrbacteria bacterium]|nr:MAG: M23 family metallopeptidase [Candidatus Uhrbacteria bacterium]
MRPHHFIHLSGIVAIVAVASSAMFAYVDVSTIAAAPSLTEPSMIELEPAAEPPIEARAVEADDKPIATPTLGLPMTDALARVTKKPFALHITPETSPVENDRFTGYHVGVDFEIFEGEEETDAPVSAICDGPLKVKGFAKGYGGYALQACNIGGEDVMVVYGHLRLESITIKQGEALSRGQTVGVLGRGHSPETDGVRKHLHLGIRRGTDVDIRGYTRNTEEIDDWIDPLPLMR